MKKNARLAAFALASALAAALPRAAGAVVIRPNAASSPAGTVPNAVNYQGRLVDNGFPVTGFRNVTFRIYDELTGPISHALQTIGPQQVSVNQGLFSTTIAISTQALAGPIQKFLEVQVGSQLLSPREQLNSVPFALVAKSLEENLAISTVSVGTQLISSGTLAVASIQALNGNSYFSIISNAHMSSSTLTLDGNATTALTTVGNVGIGTANPGSKLNVSSGTVIVDGNAATTLVLDNSASLPVLRFREAGADKGTIKSVSGSVVIDGDVTGSHDVLINTNSSGNVGVGAAIPGTKFDVQGNAQFGNAGTKTQISALGAVTVAPGAAINLTQSGGFITSKSSINASAFFGDGASISNVNAVTVPASGVTAGSFQSAAYNFPTSLGIGTLLPVTKLDVVGSAQFGSAAAKSTFTAAGVLQLASPLSTTYGGTGQDFSAIGINRIPFFSAAGTMGTIAAGASAQVLRIPTAGTVPSFGALDLAQTNATTNQLPTSRGGTGQDWSAVAAGALPYFNGAGAMTTLPSPVAANQVLTASSGGNPSWAAISGLSAGTASSLAGGAANQMPYQSAPNVTTFVSAPGANMVLFGNNGAPSWTNTPTFTGTNISGTAAGLNIGGNAATATSATTATNIAGGAANQLPLQSGGGSTGFVAAPGANSVLFGNSGAPTWTNTPTLTGTNFSGIPNGALSNSAVTVSAGAGLSGGGAVSLGGSTSLSLNVGNSNTWSAEQLHTAAIRLFSQSKAQLAILVPAAVGQVYFCNNCQGAVGATGKIVVSTGTGAGNFADAAGGLFQ